MLGTKVYVANWAITGLGDKPLAAGDRVVAEEGSEQVEELLDLGALGLSDDQSDLTVDLSSLSKAELVEYAAQKYGAVLDKSQSKAALLQTIAQLELHAEALREASAEASRKAEVAAAAADAAVKAEAEQHTNQ